MVGKRRIGDDPWLILAGALAPKVDKLLEMADKLVKMYEKQTAYRMWHSLIVIVLAFSVITILALNKILDPISAGSLLGVLIGYLFGERGRK